MITDSINRANPGIVTDKKIVEPKILPQIAAETIKTDGTARLSNANLQGDLLKFRLQNKDLANKPLNDFTPMNLVNGLFDVPEGKINVEKFNGEPPYAPGQTPEEAAANTTGGDFGEPVESQRAQAFATTLKVHKDDPEWIEKYLDALGTKKTAEYIKTACTADPNNVFGITKETAKDNAANVRAALEKMVDKGSLTFAGMKKLVDELKNGGAEACAEIFGKSKNYALVARFLDAAAASGDKEMYSAAAYVLSRQTPAHQESFVNQLANAGKLKEFIAGAMSSDFQPGGIPEIVKNAAKFSPAMQKEVFNAVAQGLSNTDAFDRFKSNVDFKDDLSTLFVKNRDALLKDAQVNSKGEDSGVLSPDFMSGMKRFLQMTLMTSPSGKLADEVKGSIFQLVQAGVTALSDKNLANKDPQAFKDFVSKFGMEPKAYAQMLGSVLGCVTDAAGYAKESLSADAAKKKETVSFFVGLAFSMIPGVGGTVKEGFEKEFAKHIMSEGASYFQSKFQGNFEDKINEFLSADFDENDQNAVQTTGKMVEEIFFQGLQDLPNGSSTNGDPNSERFDFQEKFKDGYDNASRFTRLDN